MAFFLGVDADDGLVLAQESGGFSVNVAVAVLMTPLLRLRWDFNL
jgi:hypothetical protein